MFISGNTQIGGDGICAAGETCATGFLARTGQRISLVPNLLLPNEYW